jgi:hypothetical protein
MSRPKADSLTFWAMLSAIASVPQLTEPGSDTHEATEDSFNCLGRVRTLTSSRRMQSERLLRSFNKRR